MLSKKEEKMKKNREREKQAQKNGENKKELRERKGK